MPKRNDGSGEDDGDVIDVLAKEPSTEERREAAEPEILVAPAEPDIEPREAILNRDEDPPPRVEARTDVDREGAEAREPRRRDETDDDYSRRVRGRINRERAVTRSTQRRLDEQIAINQELREGMARIERRQVASETTGESTRKINEIKAKIEGLKTKILAAGEAGETKLGMELNIELGSLIADQKILEQRIVDQAAAASRQVDTGDQGADRQADPDEARIARATRRWQTANRKWWNLNKFQPIKDDAVELDKDLRQEVKDGLLDLEEYSDEYFAELSTRLKENYPDLDVRGPDGEAIEAEPDLDRDARNRDDTRGSRDREDRDGSRRPAPRRHPGGNMGTRDGRRGGGDPRQLAEQGRVRLTDADYAQMRTYGLDPNDQKQKKAFARERLRTIMTGDSDTRRGGGR